MHPEIEQDRPGARPKCGMDLEPKTVGTRPEEDDAELRSMTRRFWVSLVLTVPVFLLAMLPMLGFPVDHWLGAEVYRSRIFRACRGGDCDPHVPGVGTRCPPTHPADCRRPAIHGMLNSGSYVYLL
jgi:hypothetical protein